MTNKAKKLNFGQKMSIFSAGEKTLEREGESSNFSLRSMEIGRSEFVCLSMKVHLFDEGYSWVPKMRDFTEDPKE